MKPGDVFYGVSRGHRRFEIEKIEVAGAGPSGVLLAGEYHIFGYRRVVDRDEAERLLSDTVAGAMKKYMGRLAEMLYLHENAIVDVKGEIALAKAKLNLLEG